MQRRQEPRTRVEILSRYRTGSGVAHEVFVYDLSRTGCLMRQNYSALEAGKQLTIRLDNVGPIEAVVRWLDGLRVGVQFLQPLHPSIMDHLTARFRKTGSKTDDVPEWAARWIAETTRRAQSGVG